jgi:hypothetical protein
MDDALMREQVLLQPEEAGRQVFAQRPLPSVWAVAIAVLLLLAFYAVVAALLDSAGGAATATGGAALVVVLLFASGMIEKHRVCERALLHGPTLPRSVPYVVPVTTIDPGSVRLHHRANFITRRLRQQGTANLRMAPYATKAVSFRGLDPLAAHPRRRQRAPAVFAEPLLRYENAPVTPVVTERWVLATHRPDLLLRAIEQVLVDAGIPGSRGLADRELRNPVVERWRRDPANTEQNL